MNNKIIICTGKCGRTKNNTESLVIVHEFNSNFKVYLPASMLNCVVLEKERKKLMMNKKTVTLINHLREWFAIDKTRRLSLLLCPIQRLKKTDSALLDHNLQKKFVTLFHIRIKIWVSNQEPEEVSDVDDDEIDPSNLENNNELDSTLLLNLLDIYSSTFESYMKKNTEVFPETP